jgi:hypothetical protein
MNFYQIKGELIPNPKLRSIARSKATRQPKIQNGDAQNQEQTDSEL